VQVTTIDEDQREVIVDEPAPGEFSGFASMLDQTNHQTGATALVPYPFILLNLFLPMLAAIQAPVIMMSQNRQDAKDRLRGELDFDVNRRVTFGTIRRPPTY
jgi:CRP-like cAMP-binding protein